jgi:predicted nuclease of predicted toxin-antitoxin system
MKLLLDTCVWGGAVQPLRDAGHDVVWAGDWAKDPGDEDILAQATAEARTLITLDKDFGELAVVHGVRHCGIIRLVNIPARLQAATCLRLLLLHQEDIGRGALLTAEPGRLRVRPPESEKE